MAGLPVKDTGQVGGRDIQRESHGGQEDPAVMVFLDIGLSPLHERVIVGRGLGV